MGEDTYLVERGLNVVAVQMSLYRVTVRLACNPRAIHQPSVDIVYPRWLCCTGFPRGSHVRSIIIGSCRIRRWAIGGL